MAGRERFPISELVERSGTPPATIHHYRRLGLLPAPRRVAANRFLYDERHVERLRLIRLLRERRRLPLAVIRRVLPDLVGMDEEEAFRPEMWDRVLAPHLRRARRRSPGARLLEAAKDAFAGRGYGEVHVEDVCREARVAKGSFYQHYRSKEHLFLAAAESAAREAVALFVQEAGEEPSSEEHAVDALARALAPRLPLFLDLLARALQGQAGHGDAAGTVLRGLAAGVGRSVRPGGLESGRRILNRAVGRLVWALAVPGAGHGTEGASPSA